MDGLTRLHLPEKVRNTLRHRAGVGSVGKLARMTRADVALTPNIGRVSAFLIDSALSRRLHLFKNNMGRWVVSIPCGRRPGGWRCEKRAHDTWSAAYRDAIAVADGRGKPTLAEIYGR